jgi:hypothetical protein
MRDLLRGIALGVLLATGILTFVYYTNTQEVIVKEKDYTVEAAVSYLQKQDYEVVKKDPIKLNVSQPEELEETENLEKETEESVEEKEMEYQLVIERGMSSIAVAELLYENGIVDDASKFNDYLEENDFEGIIRVGTYQLNEQMSYKEIAIMITN